MICSGAQLWLAEVRARTMEMIPFLQMKILPPKLLRCNDPQVPIEVSNRPRKHR
jgi:hypothetical protein